MYRMILASGSPRRKEILEQAGVKFQIIPSQKEEQMTDREPEEVVKELALCKAKDIADSLDGNVIVIGADTIVVNAGKILGKPCDELDAVNMIMNLQGHSHNVYTGVCIIVKNENYETQIIQFAENTKVRVADMEKEQAMSYVLSGEPMDKAGSYGIQGKGFELVKSISGDYYSVMGLPIASLKRTLTHLGLI